MAEQDPELDALVEHAARHEAALDGTDWDAAPEPLRDGYRRAAIRFLAWNQDYLDAAVRGVAEAAGR